MTWKRHSLTIVITSLVLCLLVATVNYVVDPFWCFGHEVPVGRHQVGFDERQQKTNWIAFNDVSFDALILGSSRVAYMNPGDLPFKAFNYSASSMKPSEFLEYASFFNKKNRSQTKAVVLGLSFFETNASSKAVYEDPSSYIDATKEIFYRAKSLLSFKLFRCSVLSVRSDFDGNVDDLYVRNKRGGMLYRRMILPVEENKWIRSVNSNIETYRAKVYGGNYLYLDNSYLYKGLLNNFPEAKLYVFVTPITSNLLEVLIDEGRWPDYERWIRTLVEVFGEVWNFMYFNEITLNGKEYYKDAHHASPYVYELIADKIFGESSVDFGIKMTHDSLNEDIDFLRKNFDENK